MSQKFTLSNPEGSIIEIDTSGNSLKFFRDPWGRESSAMPDIICQLDKPLPAQLNETIKLYLSQNEYESVLSHFTKELK
jgi:hypothetical protein